MTDEPKKIAACEVPALRFKQWLPEWDAYASVKATKTKPKPFIYMFNMPAGELRLLSDVYRRKRDGDVAEGIQRFQDRSRTGLIQRYVRHGYPYGDLAKGLQTPQNYHLRKPGWLPTAIVINILKAGDQRRGRVLDAAHVVEVVDEGKTARLLVPEMEAFDEETLPPFEVIDGQHRLWAFDPNSEDSPIPADFELPVVAFHGLDINWQAYLFWSINVSPKRINRSHAFDLYPLLRSQDWLEQVGELAVYRQARAQELTELLYSSPESPWHHRINMLGEKGGGAVSQNSWVHALGSSVLGTGKGASRPGLFQTELEKDGPPLSWTRGQQGAFLIQFWKDLQSAIEEGHAHWWIRAYKEPSKAFRDKTSLLNQDMGLRAVLSVLNDIFFAQARNWKLDNWRVQGAEDASISDETVMALTSIGDTEFRRRLQELASGLARFDWRSLEGPGVKGDDVQEVLKRSFRGSGGYTALRLQVLRKVAEGEDEVSEVASELTKSLDG